MKTAWLIANSMSRTTDEAVIADTARQIEDVGASLVRQVDLSREDLPKPPDNAPDVIISLGGDGTANAVIERYGTEDGPLLLVLPGGTMNLLARKLHGDASIEEVIERAFADGHEIKLPLIESPDIRSMVGVIAGPAAAWGDVREDLRRGALNDLTDDIKTALSATFGDGGVRLQGKQGRHSALFVEAGPDGLLAHDIQTESLADLAQHGWAWLNRDFLGGPTEKLAKGDEIVIESDRDRLTLLVDGERSATPAPLRLSWKPCPARLLATLNS